MKNKITYSIITLFIAQLILLSACLKDDDLVTENAKSGGLLVPNGSIAYLLGATPKVDVAMTIPTGPGIKTVEVYNNYLRREDTVYSNKVLLKTIDVSLANVSQDFDSKYSITYADLIKDLKVKNVALPADENMLPIGDSWFLTYVSVMDDGRRVVNNAVTQIDVSNRWAGSYLLSGYVLRAGDPVLSGYLKNVPWKLATAGKKSVVYWKTHLWADKSTVGGIGPWVLTIDDSAGPNSPMPVTVTDAINPAVKNNPAYNSRYEPSSKTFFISVYWGSGPTNRAAVDTLVYSGPY